MATLIIDYVDYDRKKENFQPVELSDYIELDGSS